MALLTVLPITRVGVAPAFVACAGGGDTFTPTTTDCFIEVKNASGTSTTVTVAIPAAYQAIPNVVYANNTFVVPITTGDRVFGPIPPQFFADPVTGLVTVTYSQVTSLTIQVFALTSP